MYSRYIYLGFDLGLFCVPQDSLKILRGGLFGELEIPVWVCRFGEIIGYRGRGQSKGEELGTLMWPSEDSACMTLEEGGKLKITEEHCPYVRGDLK